MDLFGLPYRFIAVIPSQRSLVLEYRVGLGDAQYGFLTDVPPFPWPMDNHEKLAEAFAKAYLSEPSQRISAGYQISDIPRAIAERMIDQLDL